MEAMVERIGPGQLMYGTDMPFQNRFCTYRQSRHWLERHFAPSTGLSDDDLALIMGGTAARVLGVDVRLATYCVSKLPLQWSSRTSRGMCLRNTSARWTSLAEPVTIG